MLARTAVPSASIAIVRDSNLEYAAAYGSAQIEPRRAATPAMRYAVGSISKEFTATALLLLQEAGKLSIDDAAGRWVPGMGPAATVSIRSLLSHTSGVRDDWPQDYDPPEFLKPTQPRDIVARWANQPLDFPTGTAWRYSNTGYTVAGLIVERAAGMPLFPFLQQRIFQRLQMTSVVDFDAAPLSAADATGYTRRALGPPRPAAKEGSGWLFAAGELAMTASDLARWDIALMRHEILSDRSFRELTTEVRLVNGAGTTYALGLHVELKSGKRLLSHGGEVGGFTAENRLYPESGVAIVVLTNEDATDASGAIADALADLLLAADSPADAAAAAGARDLFKQLFHAAGARGLSNQSGAARRTPGIHAATLRPARRIFDSRVRGGIRPPEPQYHGAVHAGGIDRAIYRERQVAGAVTGLSRPRSAYPSRSGGR